VIRPLIFALPGNQAMADALCAALNGEMGHLETRNFPDGETYLRLLTDPNGRSVVLVCTLDHPDGKFLLLAFAAAAARDLGASRVGLVAPYLAYMRQDRRFNPGEAVTSVTFSHILSSAVDWLVTVDPHLHRYGSLDEIYPIPSRVVHSASLLSDWIKSNVDRPFIIGPDIESEQWVAQVAASVGARYRVLSKTRYGDRNVEIAVPDLGFFSEHTPVLVDDIVSSGRTMIETARHLHDQGMRRPVCIAVHALFSQETYDELKSKSAAVVTTNSVAHPSNRVDLARLIAAAAASELA
jgi:ribose-phosphate pyrophosphokinase